MISTETSTKAAASTSGMLFPLPVESIQAAQGAASARDFPVYPVPSSAYSHGPRFDSENGLFDDFACHILRKRYLLRNSEGSLVETPVGMIRRVARFVASAEASAERAHYAEEFERIMSELLFLPNSPTLANAGKLRAQLAACYVIPVEDSMEGIFESLKEMALVHKSGGGTGFNFSNLRRKGAIVNSTFGAASGPLSFMKLFSAATEAVKQGGLRRGANMGILNDDHPDIVEFIESKKKPNNGLENFNISVLFSDETIERNDGLLRLVAEAAWSGGEPGVLFRGAINEKNAMPWLGELTATNPCGESPLLPYEACNLGSINLSRFVDGGTILMRKLDETTRLATRFLDDVIDVNVWPLPKVAEAVGRSRKIGLGVMGFADMLARLRIPYDSADARAIAERIMSRIRDVAMEESMRLARERGALERLDRRNSTLTCVAPTGTLALLADCSSGMEPYFALDTEREVFDYEAHGGARTKKGLNKHYLKSVSQGLPPSRLKSIFRTSGEISPLDHVGMQAAFQKYVDLAVSKTVNLPNDATVEDVETVYKEAWRQRCKGVTVFRDGCLPTQVLRTKNDKCPNCGLPIVRSEGCVKCSACAWGMCSL